MSILTKTQTQVAATWTGEADRTTKTSFSSSQMNPLQDEPYLSLVCSFLNSWEILSKVCLMNERIYLHFQHLNRKQLVTNLLRREFGKSYKNPKNIEYIGFNSENENNWTSYIFITRMYNQDLYPDLDIDSHNLAHICASIFKSKGLIALKHYITHKLSEKKVYHLTTRLWKLCALWRNINENVDENKVSESVDEEDYLSATSELIQLFDETSDSCDEYLCLFLKILASSEYKEKQRHCLFYAWKPTAAKELVSCCKQFVNKRFENESVGMQMIEEQICPFLEQKNVHKPFVNAVKKYFVAYFEDEDSSSSDW